MRYSSSKYSVTLKTRFGVVGCSRSLKSVPFDRSYMTFCWSAIVSVALSGTVFELFDVEWYHDFEIWVRDHSRSFKPVPFESSGAVSYLPFIVTMALSCINCEIKCDIGNPCIRRFPQGGPRRNIDIPFGVGKLEWWGYPMVENFEDIYNRLDSIAACDRRTSCHGIVRAMHAYAR